MRALSLLLPASLLVVASSAGAQTTPYPQPVAETISTVQVVASARHAWIRPAQARQIGGAYDMSNGWYLEVETASRHIDATIDKQPPMRLVPVSRYKFVSGDGNVIMEFAKGSSGDDMVMSYRPSPRMAWIVVGSAPLAQR